MYHVLGYQANTFGQTNFDSTPFQDTYVPIQNNHYLPPIPMKLFGGWFGGTLLTSLTLVTPKTRMVVPPRLYPIQQTTLPPDRPHIWDRRANPFVLNAIEEVSVQMTVGGAAAAPTTAILFAGDQLEPVPPGDVYSLHGVSSTPAVANAWTQVAITWDQSLPAGNYTIVGSQHQSANAIAHRWYFRTSPMKPGFLSINSLGNITDPSYYYGGWGALGTFNTTAYPFVEVLANAADASHDFVMNFVKVG